jgi:hypothetical protein
MTIKKSFYLKQFSFQSLAIFLFSTFSFYAYSSISPAIEKGVSTNPQMINLNMQFRAKNKTMKSELSMPFYQTAEIERKFDSSNNVFIEVNPRHGKNNNEVSIEMKFYKTSGAKAFAKKEIVAKLGEESKISVKGMTVRITPVL